MNTLPDHPDIRAAELTGYPAGFRFSKPVGQCLYCGEYIEGDYVKSFDGMFCNMECCHNYYEIKEAEIY